MTAETTELRGLALLDAAIARIEAHPETWTQDTYRCGTGMCVAGWICQLGGAEWAAPADETAGLGEYVIADAGDSPLAITASDGRRLVHCPDRAERLLGRSRDCDHGNDDDCAEAGCCWHLFAPENDLDGIRAWRDMMAAGVTP